MAHERHRKNSAANWLAIGIALAFLALMAAWVLHPPEPPGRAKVVIGTQDKIYRYHDATDADARALGQALKSMGFFTDKGATVLLSKGRNGTIVSFFVNDGAWDRPDSVANFEEMGRRVAGPLGGFPLKVRLLDSAGAMRKESSIGKTIVGARDEIYYFGSATDADAAALGQALRTAGFFTDRGASVALAKDSATTLSFVVDENAWERPEIVAAFENLTRQAAHSIGGLPIRLRLLNSQMEARKDVTVQ